MSLHRNNIEANTDYSWQSAIHRDGQYWSVYELQTTTGNTSESYMNWRLHLAMCLYIGTILRRIWTTGCNRQYMYTSGQLWSVYELHTATGSICIHRDNFEEYMNYRLQRNMSINRDNFEAYMDYKLQLPIHLHVGTTLKRIWTTDCNWEYIYISGQH